MADKEEGNKKYILNKAVPAPREKEEKDATANQVLSVPSLTTNNFDWPHSTAVSQGQRESCEFSALFQSQINLQREIPAGLFAKPTIKNELQVDTHQQDDSEQLFGPLSLSSTMTVLEKSAISSFRSKSIGRKMPLEPVLPVPVHKNQLRDTHKTVATGNTLSVDTLARRRQDAKERKTRSRAKLKSPKKTADESAKRQQRRKSRSPEKIAHDNAKRREKYAKMTPEKLSEDNAKRRVDYAKMSPDKKKALNERKAELQRMKYYSPRLREINEERRYKYLHMRADEYERVRKHTSERVRLHRARKMGPSVECADTECKTLVPLSRDERFCGRHRGPIVARSGWNGKTISTVYKNRRDEDSTISLQALIEKYGDLTQCAEPDCKTNTNLGPYLTAGHKCVRCRVDKHDTCNHGHPELVQMFDWGGFPKYCQVCQPGCIDIEYHRAQPIEYKCYNQAMYSSVIEPFILMKDLGSWVWVDHTPELPTDIQNCIDTECLHYCFMGYCSSNCKKKERHIQVLRSYDSDLGGKFKLLLQFRNRALEYYTNKTKPEDRESNFVWRTQAKCDCCSLEFEVQDLISCDDKGHLVCKMCLQKHVQATFEHRRQAALVQDESFVQFKMESLAQSMQSPNDFDIECPNCGCIFRDVILREMLGLPLPVQAKTEEESAAVSIQKTFRRFRIRWRYYHSSYGRQKIDCLRSYKEWNEEFQRGKAAVSIQTTFRLWKSTKLNLALPEQMYNLALNNCLKYYLEQNTYYYRPRHSDYLMWRDSVNGCSYTIEANGFLNHNPPSNEMIAYLDSLFLGDWVSKERWKRENLAALSIQTAYRWWEDVKLSGNYKQLLLRNKSFVKLNYHVRLKRRISQNLSAHTTKIMESPDIVDRPQTSTYEMIKSTPLLFRLNKPVMRGLVSTDEWRARKNKIEPTQTYNRTNIGYSSCIPCSIVTIKTAAKGVFVSWCVRPDGTGACNQLKYIIENEFERNYRCPSTNICKWYKDVVVDNGADVLQVHHGLMEHYGESQWQDEWGPHYKEDLVKDWKISGFVDRKDPQQFIRDKVLTTIDIERKMNGILNPWRAMVSILTEEEELTEQDFSISKKIGKKIASILNQTFNVDNRDTSNLRDTFRFRCALSADKTTELLPLCHYLQDKDVMRVFVAMYDGKENKEVDLRQENELLRSFFGTAERGQRLLHDIYTPTSQIPTCSPRSTVKNIYSGHPLLKQLDDDYKVKYHQIDSVQTAVKDVYVSWSTRPPARAYLNQSMASYIEPMIDYFNEHADNESLVDEWGIAGFLTRRDYNQYHPNTNKLLGSEDSKGNRIYWNAIVTISTSENSNPTIVGSRIAKVFTNFTNQKFSGKQSKKQQFQYVFRDDVTDSKPSPLAKYLDDDSVAAVFMRMHGHNEKELHNNELLINFFGDADRGRHLLRHEDFKPEAAPQDSKLDSNWRCSVLDGIKSCDNSSRRDEDSSYLYDDDCLSDEESDASRLKKGFDAERGGWVCDSDGEGSCYWFDNNSSDWDWDGDDVDDDNECTFTFYKDVDEYGKRYVSDDDEEEESVVVSDIGEYDTEDDDNFILEHLEALRFNFDELEMLGCETLMA